MFVLSSKQLTVCLFILLIFISTCCSRELSIYEFDSLVKDRKYLFVYFYSDSCENCSKILFTWQLLEKRILSFTDSKLVIGQVDCGIHKELCSRERVKEVPSLKLYTALNDITQLEFIYDQADIDLALLENFLRKKLPNSIIEGNYEGTGYDDEIDNVNESGFKLIKKDKVIHWVLKGFYELTDEDFSLFLAAKGENLVYFYTPWCKTCQKLEPKWELVIKSLELRTTRLSRINCAQNQYACKFYLVEEYPTLLWISNGQVKQRYKNLIQSDSTKDFMFKIKFLVSFIETPELHDKLQVNLNTEDFRQFVNSGYYFVHFTVPWSKHCLEMESDWHDLVDKAYNMNVKIAKVDCSVNEKLCDLEQVDGYPTLYLYKNGRRLGEYEGSRTADSFLEYLQQFLQIHSNDEL